MGFDKNFFSVNRKRLEAALPGHFLVFTAHSLLQSAADMAFPFRQDSSFYYFTGLNEPDLILTIDTDIGESTIYLPEQNDYQKEWDGALDKKDIVDKSGIPLIATNSQLESQIKKAKKAGKKIGYLPALPERVEPYGFYANPARRNLENRLIEAGIKQDELLDVRKEVSRLRQVKQLVEIQAIQSAIDITGKSLAEVKARLGELKTEKEVERTLSAAFLTHGSDGHAFEPIVASGKNAAIIHYEKKHSVLEQNGLLLMDVGSQVDGYASDISRTWVIGKPTKRQQQIWDACIKVQEKGFAMLKPGVMLREYQKQLEVEMEKVLQKLDCSMAGQPFPHGFSHFMGLDAHDAGLYDEPLVAGSVLTVEPGIYLPDEGIGVRVEDNVLITKNGVKILSEGIPKLL